MRIKMKYLMLFATLLISVHSYANTVEQVADQIHQNFNYTDNTDSVTVTNDTVRQSIDVDVKKSVAYSWHYIDGRMNYGDGKLPFVIRADPAPTEDEAIAEIA